jgi:hypothetical protein
MRFKAVLTSLLVLGSSSAAMANPRFSHSSYERSHHYMERSYSDRPYGYQVQPSSPTSYSVQTFAYGQNPYQANIARADWSLLASNVNLDNGQASMSLGNARFAALELQAERGGSFIRDVIVDLDDGRQVRVSPNRPLDVQQAPNLRIDLGAGVSCGVRGVTIVGDGNQWARFRVIGG